MFKPLSLTLAICGLLTTLPAFRAQADIVITITPSQLQQMFPRGTLFFSCTNVAALQRYLDTGFVSAGCGGRAMTAATPRSFYEATDGTDFVIYRFQIGFWDYYTYNHQRWWRWRW